VDWTTASAHATGVGTLVLAIATFASVRSANRSARVAERALLAGQRPLLVPSRLEDATQKAGFMDGKWLHLPGGQGATEVTEDAIYLAMSLRNVGTGIAVLHGWRLNDEGVVERTQPELEGMTRLTRDLYISPGDTGFWQGSFRDPASPEFVAARHAIEARERLIIEILYGDFEGGQRMLSVFAMSPREGGGWVESVGRHWSVDGPDPRERD
jgi:hypothetical protein